MAITDNIIFRMQAEAGQAAPKNAIGSLEELTGATATLVDVSSEKAWNFANGVASAAIPSHSMSGTTSGTGITIAMRWRVNTEMSGDFSGYFGIAQSSSSNPTDDGVGYTKAGAGNYRMRAFNGLMVFSLGTRPSGVFTVVLKVTTDASGSEYAYHWVYTGTPHGTSNPDQTSDPFTGGSSYPLDTVVINATGASTSIDVLDLIYWNRELTNQECADVADGLRTQLPPLGDGTEQALAGGATGSGLAAAAASIAKTLSGGAVGDADAVANLDVSANIVFQATLVDYETGAPIANWTGLRWSWWPSIADWIAGANMQSGTGASTDGSGVLEIGAESGLTPGADQGIFLVTDYDGSNAETARWATGQFDVVET